MNVAVFSLCRDRLDFTKHCFQTLRANAGCHFDHYVLDQGSTDGTGEWLENQGVRLTSLTENVGISRGLNTLLDEAGLGYDVYVKFDNDCELLSRNTLAHACEIVTTWPDWIVSPKIEGLNQPPGVEEFVQIGPVRLGRVGMIGGIFQAVPGWVFQKGYRHDEDNPTWGMDDVGLGSWFQGQGGKLGYMLGYIANHYQTTEGQKQTYPEYWERKKTEMGI